MLKVLFHNDYFLQIETLHLVVKAMLPGPVSVKESKKFLKEVHFYSNIVPTLEQFEASANIPETERIDAFARYFCSRLSLNPGEILFYFKFTALRQYEMT